MREPVTITGSMFATLSDSAVGASGISASAMELVRAAIAMLNSGTERTPIGRCKSPKEKRLISPSTWRRLFILLPSTALDRPTLRGIGPWHLWTHHGRGKLSGSCHERLDRKISSNYSGTPD